MKILILCLTIHMLFSLNLKSNPIQVDSNFLVPDEYKSNCANSLSVETENSNLKIFCDNPKILLEEIPFKKLLVQVHDRPTDPDNANVWLTSVNEDSYKHYVFKSVDEKKAQFFKDL